jgi:glutamate synthase domain-containing protein 1
VLGDKANATRPEIEQILISNAKGVDEETFERELYVIRRRIEKAAAAGRSGAVYLQSLSCRSIIYKGMMLAEQVAEFYPDLMDERFESPSRSITSAIPPTPSPSGGWPSRSACWPITARSTRSRATSTG